MSRTSFQTPNTPTMEAIVNFHSYVWQYLNLILLTVFMLVGFLLFFFGRRFFYYERPEDGLSARWLVKINKRNLHNFPLEIFWTVVPAIFLFFLAVPSFNLLYFIESQPFGDITYKVMGSQWFWNYETTTTVREAIYADVPKSIEEQYFKDTTSIHEYLKYMLYSPAKEEYAKFHEGKNGWRWALLGNTGSLIDFTKPGGGKGALLGARIDEAHKYQMDPINGAYRNAHLRRVWLSGIKTVTDSWDDSYERANVKVMGKEVFNKKYYWSSRFLYLWVSLHESLLFDKLVKRYFEIKGSRDLAQFRGINVYEFKHEFDSYMQPESELKFGEHRLLEVDEQLIMPTRIRSRVMVTGSDVVHSWAVPSFGVKVDAIPGRLNSQAILPRLEGRYYGQCSELCGINHGFMPISVQTVTPDVYWDYVEDKLYESGEKYFRDLRGQTFREIAADEIRIRRESIVRSMFEDAYDSWDIPEEDMDYFKKMLIDMEYYLTHKWFSHEYRRALKMYERGIRYPGTESYAVFERAVKELNDLFFSYDIAKANIHQKLKFERYFGL